MADLVDPKTLISRYPDTAPEAKNAGMPYSTLGSEGAALIAIGEKPAIVERCTACGLRGEVWSELKEAHYDFVSAQAHWGAARTFGIADATIQVKVDQLEFLTGEMLDQASFYLKGPDDIKRLAEIREGDGLPDMIQDARQLVLLIRPRRQAIVDPEFKTEWLDEAVALAEVVEKALASRAAEAAVGPEGQQMRRVRDRTVARLQDLIREIRHYGKHAYRRDIKLRAAFASEYLRRKRRRAGGDEEPIPTV